MIIGVDPGSGSNCGLAMLGEDGMTAETLIIKGGKGLSLLHDTAAYMASREPGSMVVFERPFIGPNRGAAIPLFEIVGVLKAASAKAGVPCISYTPSALRSQHGVTEKGKAGKGQMIARMRALGHDPQDEHQADAMALIEMLLTMGVK